MSAAPESSSEDPLVIDEGKDNTSANSNTKAGDDKKEEAKDTSSSAPAPAGKPDPSASAASSAAPNNSASAPNSESGGDDDEDEFEPTIDMMMNDFDDERTMEEEEQQMGEAEEDNADEVDELAREGDMPLEELLKMYGYGGAGAGATDGAEEEEEEEEEDGGDGDGSNIKKGEEPAKSSEAAPAPVAPAVASPKAGEKRPHPEEGEAAASSEAKDKLASATSSHEKEKAAGDAPASPSKAAAAASNPMGSPAPPAKKSKSELAKFYEAAVGGQRELRSTKDSEAGGGNADGEEEGSDGEESSDHEGASRDYSWKKTIMIGPTYQAQVPGGMTSYDSPAALPYELKDDKLLWDPTAGALSPPAVESYLARAQSDAAARAGVSSLPAGAHVRDDEQALYVLQQCGHNVEEALRRRRTAPGAAVAEGAGAGGDPPGSGVPPTADTLSLWSEEECRSFELGLRLYGKDFHMIQQQKVRSRSVGELVQFYYLWKKTERHDVFANATRMEKKKYALHPGTTDYMDRFIDDSDPPPRGSDRSSSPNFHSLLYGTTAGSGTQGQEVKKGLILGSKNGSGVPITAGAAASSEKQAPASDATSQQASVAPAPASEKAPAAAN